MRGISKNRGLTYGLGINDADYVTCKTEKYMDANGKQRQRQIWHCPFHLVWTKLIYRFSPEWLNKYPTYENVDLFSDWIYFSKFKSWMETQDWEGKQLDKDLLSGENKIYSPDTCIFIPQELNKFLIDFQRKGQNSELPKGAYPTTSGRFMSKVSNPFSGRLDYLGYFDTAEEAHIAWRGRKLEFALLWAEKINDERVTKSLVNKYQNYEESK